MSSSKVTDYKALFVGDRPLIDVRAPVEFAKGAFPTATNIPLLSDEARHKVGIEYKQAGQERAIELGAKLIPESVRAELTQQWLDFLNLHPDANLYCFRGGLRSKISQSWIRDAGGDVPIVEGGYKQLRHFLIDNLNTHCSKTTFCLIGGRTGSGKTRLLNRLAHTVDLENLARHRGSSFGRLAVAQPSNIDFENAISIALLKLSVQDVPRVFLEDEARMIGSACIPHALRQTMQQAPVVVLQTPISDRIQFAIEDYVVDLLNRYTEQCGDQGFEQFAEYHRQSLYRVRKRFGGERYALALDKLNAALDQHRQTGDTELYKPFIELILTEYYDPMYDYQTRGKQARVVFSGSADDIVAWSKHHAAA